jgi:hypothetical protein
VTSSVSPYLQRPVRKLEEIQPEAKPAPSQTQTAADHAANAGASPDAPLHPPEAPPND